MSALPIASAGKAGVAILALAAIASCASAPSAMPTAAPESGAMTSAEALSHCSRGCPQGAPAGNEEVRHAFYTLSNNRVTKFADWVAYIVDPDLVGGPDRPRNWKADPQLEVAVTLEPADYDSISQLRMDRGHQAPLESFTRSPFWREANYLSNITPQDLNLNRGRWARLEAAERQLAQGRDALVYVVTGPLYETEMEELPNADDRTASLRATGRWSPCNQEALPGLSSASIPRRAHIAISSKTLVRSKSAQAWTCTRLLAPIRASWIRRTLAAERDGRCSGIAGPSHLPHTQPPAHLGR